MTTPAHDPLHPRGPFSDTALCTIDLAHPPANLFGQPLLGTVDVPDFGAVELAPLIGDLRSSDRPSALIHRILTLAAANPPHARTVALRLPAGNFVFDAVPGTDACIVVPPELTTSLTHQPIRTLFDLGGTGHSTVAHPADPTSTWLRLAPNPANAHQAGMWTVHDVMVDQFAVGMDLGPHGFDFDVHGMWFSGGRRHVIGNMLNGRFSRVFSELATEVGIALGVAESGERGHLTVSGCTFWANNVDVSTTGSAVMVSITGNQFETYADYGPGNAAGPHLALADTGDIIVANNLFWGMRVRPGRANPAIALSNVRRARITGNMFRDYRPPSGLGVIDIADSVMVACVENTVTGLTGDTPAVGVRGASRGVEVRGLMLATDDGPTRSGDDAVHVAPTTSNVRSSAHHWYDDPFPQEEP